MVGDPEVFKRAEVIAFNALMTLTAVAVIVKVICSEFIAAAFDVMDQWCKRIDERRRKADADKEKL